MFYRVKVSSFLRDKNTIEFDAEFMCAKDASRILVHVLMIEGGEVYVDAPPTYEVKAYCSDLAHKLMRCPLSFFSSANVTNYVDFPDDISAPVAPAEPAQYPYSCVVIGED